MDAPRADLDEEQDPTAHPAVLAKMAETLDRLSGGRLILGMGGGYDDEEFRAIGLGDRIPRDKVDRMAEAILIARGLCPKGPSPITVSCTGPMTPAGAEAGAPNPDLARHVRSSRSAGDGRLADGSIPTYELALPEHVPSMRNQVLAAARATVRARG
jgi:alkanesulfonate monooxygenase SsuD/methylene tetrahydromethanopterin reductase-like flavin-dependent oxidoreductase (luciferase family)